MINLTPRLYEELVLVLAGGRGQRLGDLTKWRVKPATPFGGKFRLIDFVLSNAVNSQLRRIGVLTQYKSQSLLRHIMSGWNLPRTHFGEFIECLPAQKRVGDNWYQGTADAVFQNIDLIEACRARNILILAGDHVYAMDYRPLLQFHQEKQADLTVCVIEMERDEAKSFGLCCLDGDFHIQQFIEKPNSTDLKQYRGETVYASMGIYVFEWSFLKQALIMDSLQHQSHHDFGKDIIPASLGDNVYAYKYQDPKTGTPLYWRDVGTVDSYWLANMDLIGPMPRLNLYDSYWPIHSAPHNYPSAKVVPGPKATQGQVIDSIISEGSIISGGTVRHSLLSQNVWIDEGAEVNQSVIMPDVHIGKQARITRSIVDSGTFIPDHMVIGEDLSADAERFTVSHKGIVLVTAEKMGQPGLQAIR